MPRQTGAGQTSVYSPGLWNWDDNLSWANNLTNRGSVNMQDFLGLDPSQLYGEDTDYLRSQLKGTIGGKLDPALMQILGAGKRNISQLGDTSRRNTSQQLAGSGFRGSGANLMNNIFQTQSGAMGDLTASVGGMSMQARENAMMQLLGLNQSMANTNTGLAGQQVGVAGQLAGMGNQQNQLDTQERMSEFNFGDFMMALAGTAGGSFGGAYGGRLAGGG
jgi:hypothetical protein